MNIEEAVEILKMWNKAEELVINESTDYDKTVYIQRKEAIETLLTAYEKEKGENVKLRLQDIPLIEGELKAYKDRVNELKQELEKEKETNKELESYCNDVRKEMNEENRRCMLLAVENQDLKEKNKKYLVNLTHEQYIKLVEQIRSEINKEWKDVIKAKIEDILNSENSEAIEKLIEWQSLLEKE